MYHPEIGDVVTFIHGAEHNRDVRYTVTEINDVEITVTTPTGYVRHPARQEGPADVFAYHLTCKQFDSLGPCALRAAP